jgi:release factor glutamine methyltransferase
VLAGAGDWLAPGGLLLSEITEAQTGAAVAAVRAAGLRPEVVADEELDARVVTARRLELPGVDRLR